MATEATGSTDILNLFDLDNEIKNVTGTFRYRFFDPLEQIEEDCRFLSNPGDTQDVPRYTLITWTKGEKPLLKLNVGAYGTLVHRENLFFASDLSTTYSIVTVDDKKLSQEQSHIVSDATTGSKLDYLLKTVASNEYTEDLEENLDSGTKTVIPVLDPTTNKPVIRTTIGDTVQTPDIHVRSHGIKKLLEVAQQSPLGGNFEDILEKAEIIQKNYETNDPNSERKLTSFEYLLSKIKSLPESSLFSIDRRNRPDNFLSNWTLVGWIVSKYRLDNGKEKYMYTRFVEETRFRDPYVAYGKTYRYQIRPVFCKYVSNKKDRRSTYIDNTVVFVGSEESAFIDVECTELKVPEPPRNPRFEYILNSNIRVTWERPESYVSDENKLFDTNDIKGYQLFIRNSLEEPYRLFRYFTFNNTVPSSLRIRASESIADDFVISSEYEISESVSPDDIPNFYEYREYIVNIRSNVDYYFALCSIDAHGNSSNYSAQYKVRRNNVTGEVDIQLVCPVGAPKQYPNLLIPGKLVQPAFKASGYKYMDIYYAPDSQVASPNIGGASMNIQLFELETEVEKNITITMKQMPKSTK